MGSQLGHGCRSGWSRLAAGCSRFALRAFVAGGRVTAVASLCAGVSRLGTDSAAEGPASAASLDLASCRTCWAVASVGPSVLASVHTAWEASCRTYLRSEAVDHRCTPCGHLETLAATFPCAFLAA